MKVLSYHGYLLLIFVSVYMQIIINTLAFDFYLIVYELYKLFLEFCQTWISAKKWPLNG